MTPRRFWIWSVATVLGCIALLDRALGLEPAGAVLLCCLAPLLQPGVPHAPTPLRIGLPVLGVLFAVLVWVILVGPPSDSWVKKPFVDVAARFFIAICVAVVIVGEARRTFRRRTGDVA